MFTLAKPVVIFPPCLVGSPTLAAGFPLIFTVEEPPVIVLSVAPAQRQLSPFLAAGFLPMLTFGLPGGPVISPPAWACGPFEAGHTCVSPILAAGGILLQ